MGGDEDLARESLPVGPDELRFNGTRDIRGEEKMGVLVGETQHEGAVVSVENPRSSAAGGG